MEEPSVLDYIKSKLNPWKHPALEIPPVEGVTENETVLPLEREDQFEPEHESRLEPAPAAPVLTARVFPWRSMAALIFALAAQQSLEPPDRAVTTGIVLYLLAAALLIWATLRGEWKAASIPEDERCPEPLSIHVVALTIGLLLAVVAFLSLGGDLFTSFNVFVWYLALVFFIRAFWVDGPRGRPWLARLQAFLARPRWNLTLSRWTLLLIGVFALAIFFRAYQLNQVPPEMNSDHAEKLLDVTDVLNGQTRIFFPRNTGREPLQFYMIAVTSRLFGTGISFTSMKIGTILSGLLTLPFIYLIGKEAGNRQVGLLAMAFAGIAYWPNVIARLALRFTLYPLFVAPALYFLIRGLRRSNRNDFILAGIALGIGLHGYTPIRILPFVVVIAVGIYLLHRQSVGVRTVTILRLSMLALIALIVFLPLLRYAMDNPDMFAYRAFTRLGTLERPLPGPAWQIFLKNLWNAMIMFGWDNGEVWTTSVPHRPALDIVSAALFYLGMVLLIVRYLLRRHWLDLFLLVSVPLLMMPSILSLAFPSENPILSRTGGAIVPVFVIIGIALQGLFRSVKVGLGSPWGSRMAGTLVVFLLAWAALQNYDLVFHQYFNNYQLSSWNTSEMGRVIREFTDISGNPDTAWVMGYPYWVDTRLVGINAGYPTKDYAMFVEQLDSTVADPHSKLFLINTQDQAAIDSLRQLYPQGWLRTYDSQVETKDFLMYIVPAQQ